MVFMILSTEILFKKLGCLLHINKILALAFFLYLLANNLINLGLFFF